MKNKPHRRWVALAVTGLALMVSLSAVISRFGVNRQPPVVDGVLSGTQHLGWYHGPADMFVEVRSHRTGLVFITPRVGQVSRAGWSGEIVGVEEVSGVPLIGRASWWPRHEENVTAWSASRYEIGFPLAAFRYHETTRRFQGGLQPTSLNGAVRLSPLPGVGHLDLPYRPLWIGFIVNWSLSTAVVWLLYRMYRARALLSAGRRRRLRIARGECMRCGYSLGGLTTCPECGNVTPPASSSA